jgi:hypothetical protein
MDRVIVWGMSGGALVWTGVPAHTRTLACWTPLDVSTQTRRVRMGVRGLGTVVLGGGLLAVSVQGRRMFSWRFWVEWGRQSYSDRVGGVGKYYMH